MDLNIFKKKEDGSPDFYWALVIGKSWLQSAIWCVEGAQTKVIAEGGGFSWEEGNEESLVSAADSSLSSAAGAVGENVPEPDKVVFGLPPTWIEDGNIKSDKMGVLKKLSGELELSPAGFVVIPEAIVHFIKSREGAPLNGILVGLSEDSIDVSLVQNGRILGSTEVAKSMDLGRDLSEGLSRLPETTQYPSRILLYDHKVSDLDEAKQKLLDTEWAELKVNFLHTPKIDILPEETAVSAVSLAGGAEVGHATGIVLPNDSGLPNARENVGAEQIETTPEAELPKTEEVREIDPEELGFLEGVDVAERTAFANSTPSVVQQETLIAPTTVDKDFDPVHTVSPVKRNQSLKDRILGPILGILGAFSFLPRMLTRLPIKFPRLGGGGIFGRLGFFGIAGLILLIVFGLFYWYIPHATVAVYVSPKKLDKTLDLTIDPQRTAPDVTNKILPGQTKEVEVKGEKTAQASGTKTVGDPAKGQVLIYHVGGPSTLKKGTTLSSTNGLKFTLDQETVVASGSSLTNPSKTQATITSAAIGAEYNLASGTEFNVANFAKSDFVAQNEAALSGGTSRTVPAVSDEDQNFLLKGLGTELLERGTLELKQTVGENEVLVDNSATFETTSKSFSDKSGEGATTIKLSLTGKVKAVTIPKDAINSLISEVLQKEVPEGFTLRQDQIEISYKAAAPVETKTDKTTKKKVAAEKKPAVFTAEIHANLLPQVNPEEIAKKITGKSPLAARDYLSTIPGFARAEISLKPKLPGPLGTLPRITKNILIEVSAEK